MAFAGKAQAQGSCSALDSTGYVLLHPYFEGKNWKKSVEDNIDVILPDTLCSQQLRPTKFDIGKSLDSTIAAFSTANGGFFIMEAKYFHYAGAGACRDELDFLTPQKLSLTGITFTGNTSWYLVKDTAFNQDTIKVVFAVSTQYLLVATIKSSIPSVVKTDTLRFQTIGTVSHINGDFDKSIQRDTCIWVTGTNGMLRHFSYRGSSWGTEVGNDITATETVLCANNLYAGTNSGKIYKKNSAQAYVLDYSLSSNAINAIYPQGAIGNNGALIENINGTWRSNILGSGNYQYANFIKRPGGFGVELLDNKWKYSISTYRDTASRILLTNPVDILVNNVNRTTPYIYNAVKIASPKDTTISIYISDPDSNYSDLAVNLNNSSMENDGTHSIGPIPDTESCHVGALRLTDGILKFTLKRDSVVLKTQTELGVMNVGCLVCNWKSYSFSYSRQWYVNSSLTIAAGRDRLIIENQGSTTTAVGSSNAAISVMKSPFKSMGNNLIFRPAGPDLKKIESVALYDLAGRKLMTFKDIQQTAFEIPRSLTSGVVCLTIKYGDGSAERHILPLLR